MKASLKRASFLANAALKAGSEVKYEGTIKLSIYSPAMNTPAVTGSSLSIQNEIDQARIKLITQHELALALITAAYAIRQQLARANINYGVTDLLNRQKAMETEEGRYRALIKVIEGASGFEKTAEAARNRGNALRTQSPDRYIGRSEDGVSVSVVLESDIEGWRKRLARIVELRSEINDTLTAANVTNSIVLSDDTVQTLQRAGLLTAPE